VAKRSRRKPGLAPRPVPVPTDEVISRLRRFLCLRFLGVPGPVTHVARARTLDNGFAADVQLFDGGRCILIVRQVEGHVTDERWCMRGKYSPNSPSGFYYNPIRKEWVRASEEEAEAAIAAGHCL
jgi:hypothetical protein